MSDSCALGLDSIANWRGDVNDATMYRFFFGTQSKGPANCEIVFDIWKSNYEAVSGLERSRVAVC